MNAITSAPYWLSLSAASVIDWQEVFERLPFACAMHECVQDATYHAEGDAWTHTRLVVEALQEMRAQSAIEQERWPGLFLAALLHDIAKPVTRSEEIDVEGRLRVHHYGHARAGAIMAWEFLEGWVSAPYS
jgi:HD domain